MADVLAVSDLWCCVMRGNFFPFLFFLENSMPDAPHAVLGLVSSRVSCRYTRTERCRRTCEETERHQPTDRGKKKRHLLGSLALREQQEEAMDAFLFSFLLHSPTPRWLIEVWWLCIWTWWCVRTPQVEGGKKEGVHSSAWSLKVSLVLLFFFLAKSFEFSREKNAYDHRHSLLRFLCLGPGSCGCARDSKEVCCGPSA